MNYLLQAIDSFDCEWTLENTVYIATHDSSMHKLSSMKAFDD